MREYEVTGAFVSLPRGAVLGLTTEDQLRRRRPLLLALGGGCFRALAPVGFKRGERFLYDGELVPHLAVEVGEKKVEVAPPPAAVDELEPVVSPDPSPANDVVEPTLTRRRSRKGR